MNPWSRWAIRVTHLPSGIAVQTDEGGCAMRSMYKAKVMLMRVLRSKIAAPSRPSGLVRTYDLTDDSITDGWGRRSDAQAFLDGKRG
jgi:protein subunit release factor B